MVIRYLLCCVVGAVLVFGWGMVTWGSNMWSWAISPVTAPEPLLHGVQANMSKGGAMMYPGYPEIPANATAEQGDAAMKHCEEVYRNGPIFMVLYQPGGMDPSDAKMLLRGFLIELFAAAGLTAVIGLGGSGHGPLRRFMVLVAAVAFMCLATHLVAWNFLFVPWAWTEVMLIDGAVGWTLAGLPAVFLLRSMREGDVPKEFRAA